MRCVLEDYADSFHPRITRITRLKRPSPPQARLEECRRASSWSLETDLKAGSAVRLPSKKLGLSDRVAHHALHGPGARANGTGAGCQLRCTRPGVDSRSGPVAAARQRDHVARSRDPPFGATERAAGVSPLPRRYFLRVCAWLARARGAQPAFEDVPAERLTTLEIWDTRHG